MAATKKNNKKKKSGKKAKKTQSQAQSQTNAPSGSSDMAQEIEENIDEVGDEINATELNRNPENLDVTRPTELQSFEEESNGISMENDVNAFDAEEITPLGIPGIQSTGPEKQCESQEADANNNSVADKAIEFSLEDQHPILEADTGNLQNHGTVMKNGDFEITQDETKESSLSTSNHEKNDQDVVDLPLPKENDKLSETNDIKESLPENMALEPGVKKLEEINSKGGISWTNGAKEEDSMPWDNEEKENETIEAMPWDKQLRQNTIGPSLTENVMNEITHSEDEVQYPSDESNQKQVNEELCTPLNNRATHVSDEEASIPWDNDPLNMSKNEESMPWDTEEKPTGQIPLDNFSASVTQEKEERMPWDTEENPTEHIPSDIFSAQTTQEKKGSMPWDNDISNTSEHMPWEAEEKPTVQMPLDNSPDLALRETEKRMPWETSDTNKEIITESNDKQHVEVKNPAFENSQPIQDDANSIEESTRLDEHVETDNLVKQETMPWDREPNTEDKLNISETITDTVNADQLFLNDLTQNIEQKEKETEDKFHFLEEDDEILLDDIMDDDFLDDDAPGQIDNTYELSGDQTVLITPAKKASKYQPASVIPPSNTFIPSQRTSLVQPHIITAVNALVPDNKKNIANAFHSQKLADCLKIEKQKSDAYDFPSDLLAKHSPLTNVKSQTESIYTRLETEVQNQQSNALDFVPPPPPPISNSRRSSHLTPISSPLVRANSVTSQTSSMNPYAKPATATGNLPPPKQSFFSELPVPSNVKNANGLHLKNPYEAIETSPSYSNTLVNGIKPKNRYSASISSDSSKLNSPKPPALNIKPNPYGPQMNQQFATSLRASSSTVKPVKPSNPYAPPEAGGHLRTPSANIPTPAEVNPNVVPVPIKSPISMISPQKPSFRLQSAYPGQTQEQQIIPPNTTLVHNQQPLSFPLSPVQHQHAEQQQQLFNATNSQSQFAPPSNIGGRYAPQSQSQSQLQSQSQTQMKQMQSPAQNLSHTSQSRSVGKYLKPLATSITDMYGSNIVTSNATSMHSRRKSVLPPAPGFTGKINVADAGNFTPAPVVINPENLVRRQWPLFSFSAANNVLSMIPSSDGYGHSITNLKISDISAVIKQEPLCASFPGPLVKGKSKKKDICKWIADKVKSLSSPDDTLISCELMIWNVLKVMMEYIDKPNDFVNNREYIQQVTKILNPSLVVSGEDSNSIDIVAISRLSQGFNQSKNYNSRKMDINGLSKIHDLLESGNKKSALELALSESDWAMALVISHIMGPSAFNQIIKIYASVTFGDKDALGQDLSFFIQSTTHEGISLDQMIGRESWLVTNYKTVMPFILLNNPNPGNFLLQLGDLLLESGNIEYSKLTFLLSGLPLIPKNLSHLPSSIDSMIIDEIYEYILLSSGNIPQTFANGFPHMVPVKIKHAGFLIDFGYHVEAKKYTDFTQSLISSKQLFCDHTTNLAQQQISYRMAQIINYGSGWLGSKLNKPKLDKVWTTLDKSFNKFVSGEEISKPEQKVDGVFSKFISPNVSRVGSIPDFSDIHQNGQIRSLANPYAKIERRSTTADITNLKSISSNVPISQPNVSNNVYGSLSSSVSLQNFHHENEKDNKLYKSRLSKPLEGISSDVKIEKKEPAVIGFPVSRTGSILEMSDIQSHVPRNPPINPSQIPSPIRHSSQYSAPVTASPSAHHSEVLDDTDSSLVPKQSAPSSPHAPYIAYVPSSTSIPPVPSSPSIPSIPGAAHAPVVPFASPIPSAPSSARFPPLESSGSTDLMDTVHDILHSPSATTNIPQLPSTGPKANGNAPTVALASKKPIRARNLYAPTTSRKGSGTLKKPAKSPYAPANIDDNASKSNPFDDMSISEDLGGYDIYTLGGYHVPPPAQKVAEDIKMGENQSQDENNIQNADTDIETSCNIDERLEDDWPQVEDSISMGNSEENLLNPPNFTKGADHLKSMFNPPTGQSSNGDSLYKAISPVHQITDQKKFYAQDTGEYYDDVVDDDDDDDDDEKKKEEARKKKEEERKQQEKLREEEREKENKKQDETKKKEAEAAKKNETGSWFGWLGKNKGDKPAPIKAKLGEKSAFYYDEDLKRWINGKASLEEQAANTPPPPPVKKASASGPPSAPSLTPVSSEPSASIPLSSMGAPPQAQQHISNLKKDNIDDLLSMASPSSTRKSKRGPRRGYVDVMAQQK